MRNLLYFIFLAFFIFSCSKNNDIFEATDAAIVEAPPNQVTICHATSSDTNPWVTITINENALQAHMAHGDINPDADGDGFTKENPCGIGDQSDCNDEDPTINPSSEELCNDNIDNNCNNEIDE